MKHFCTIPSQIHGTYLITNHRSNLIPFKSSYEPKTQSLKVKLKNTMYTVWISFKKSIKYMETIFSINKYKDFHQSQ